MPGTYISPAETGFYYLQSRYYDAGIERFINADSYLSTGQNFLGHNAFAYCGNNPVNRVDADGDAWETVIDILSLGYSALEVIEKPKDGWAWAGFAGDLLDLIPFVTGIGEATRAVSAVANSADVLDDVHDITKTLDTIDDAVDTAKTVKRTDTISNVFGAACFVAGTNVSTEKGYSAIEDLGVGDLVWSENPETGERGLKRIVQTFVNETSELIHVFVNGEEIVTTLEHPFYVLYQEWTEAIRLRAGDVLILQTGEHVVVEMVQHEILETPISVYNFEVEEFHTYYVSKSRILVHNSCVVKENGVKIESYYPQDHGGPAHLHVIGGGESTKIGPQGLPLKGNPALTPKQAMVVENNLPLIKKTIKQIQKKLRVMQ